MIRETRTRIFTEKHRSPQKAVFKLLKIRVNQRNPWPQKDLAAENRRHGVIV